MICTIIILTLIVLNLGIHLAKHGETREEKYNFIIQLIADIIVCALFYGAGMFDCFIK